MALNMRDYTKVFLGGTCNGSTWREDLVPLLTIDYFNPVVKNWTKECQAEELRQREVCDFCLYVITPDMMGVYSIAEAVDDSNKRPDKTIFCWHDLPGIYDRPFFNKAQISSLEATGKLIKSNGGQYFLSLVEVAEYLNHG
jgi:hypothetical protein